MGNGAVRGFMPLLVNGEAVPEDLVREEMERLRRDPRWASVTDLSQREAQLRAAAEHSAIDRFLLESAAANDPQPLDAVWVDQEMERQRAAAGGAFDDSLVRKQLEQHLRLARLVKEFTAHAVKPSAEDIENFYESQRENFRNPDLFQAAHIVVHVNEKRTEQEAEAAIQVALAELESGEDFSAVAERHSDCKGTGGDLGSFPAGHMVEEFEKALREVSPGQRTGVFTTPFGFHIALLNSLTPSRAAGFEEVRHDIERVLTAMSEHQEYLKGIERLRKQATIQRVPDDLAASAKQERE